MNEERLMDIAEEINYIWRFVIDRQEAIEFLEKIENKYSLDLSDYTERLYNGEKFYQVIDELVTEYYQYI